MLKKEYLSICKFYAISPIHAGTGAGLSAIDLPIQRERHTNWPHIQASGVKGAMRDHFRRFANNTNDKALINYIFGTDYDNDGQENQLIMVQGEKIDSPGAVSFSDAKLLAFPMRSNIAPFVWVTSPSVLKRLKQDFEFVGIQESFDIPTVKEYEAIALSGELTGDVLLEDAVVNINPNLKAQIPVIQNRFSELERLVLISDEMFDYCVSSCTEVQTRIKIDSSTGTVMEGALLYQELLPADSLLYSVVYFSNAPFKEHSEKSEELIAEAIMNKIKATIKDFIQIGGDETLGRGICKVDWLI